MSTPFIGRGPSDFYLEVIREDWEDWAGLGRGVGNRLRLVDVHNVLRVDLKKDYTSGLDFRLKSVDRWYSNTIVELSGTLLLQMIQPNSGKIF